MSASSPQGADPLITSCHCGRVQIEIPRKPDRLNECHCSVCYKYGALWGYFHLPEVKFVVNDSARLEKYVRSDEGSEGDVSFNRCGHCGCLTHWEGEGEFREKYGVGINCRLLPESAIKDIEVKVSRKDG